MWFLIKGTFWFSMVLVLLPMLDRSAQQTLDEGPNVELGGTFTAASEALSYVGAMCAEKPDVCQKGAETFVALGHRAREGARIAYEFLDDRFEQPADAVKTGAVRLAVANTETQATKRAASTDEPVADKTISIEEASIDDILNLPIPEKRVEPHPKTRP